MTMLQQAALQLPMWMGKASERCVAVVVFNTLKYSNLVTLLNFVLTVDPASYVIHSYHAWKWKVPVICSFCFRETLSFGLISLNQY